MKIFVSIILLSSFINLACKKNESTQTASSATVSTVELESKLHLLDASTSKVGVSSIAVSLGDFGVSVPTFTIDYSNNNFVQILRCAASYHQSLEEQYAKVAASTDYKERRWPWDDAFGNPTFCKVVSTKTSAKEYADLAASNGRFFYIINPCVTAEFSTSKQEECSYNLTFTDNFEFKDALSDQFTLQASKLGEAESTYDGTVLLFMGLTQSLMDLQNSCLVQFQNEQAKKDAQQFWGDIGTVIGGSVLTGVLGFLGPRLIKNKSGNFSKAVQKHPYIAAGAVMTGAAGIATIIRRITSTGAALGPSCAQAEKVANLIQEMKDKNILSKAQEAIITESNKLSALNTQFSGYDVCVLTADPGACAKGTKQ